MKASGRIAIVGIGGVFPEAARAERAGTPAPAGGRGEGGGLARFWEHVKNGRSLARTVPEGRWPLAAADVYSATGGADKVYSTRGCFVEDAACDADGLAISPALLRRLDPMFHLLLRAGREAWRDAATGSLNLQRVGVIVGNIALPTDAASRLAEEILEPAFAAALGVPSRHHGARTEPLNGLVAGLPAALLARALGLGGGSYALDAACASSLYALKLAAEELLAGRADAMLTGGVSRPDCLYTQMGFAQLGALSHAGLCAPFDRRADGLLVGEGAGVLVLKRLDDALRDGDHIYATIAGIGLSNDIGGTLMQPESAGQLRAMRAAYRQAEWSPQDVDLVECHGTGTPVGDGVEFQSLCRLWGAARRPDRRCIIGSVKSNIGHLLTAAGAAGLIKVLLAMREGVLPPTANFFSPATGIDLEASPFEVARAAIEWARHGTQPRRAAVSAFGFGGINAHVLLEEWQDAPRARTPVARDTTPPPVEISDIAAEPVAIVGMGAHLGPWTTMRAAAQRMLGGGSEAGIQEARSWGSAEGARFQGYLIDEVRIPVGAFRIPPAELADMLPQQLLMLQVAAEALEDARLGTASTERLETGVFIGIGLDLNTTNFRFRWTLQEKAQRWARELHCDMSPQELQRWTADLRQAAGPALSANRTMGALGGIVASRVARAFHVGGPSFTISCEENSGLRALEAATRALQRGELNVALVGAVDLAGDVRAAVARTHEGLIGEGAAALVLKRLSDARRDGDKVYAVIGGIGVASGDDSSTSAKERALMESHSAAATVSYTEHCRADSDTAARIGHAGAPAGLVSLIKTAWCMHHEILPPSQDGAAARYWLRDRSAGPRRAAVSARGIDGNSVHVLLEAPEDPDAPAAPREKICYPSAIRPSGLFRLAASNPQGLLAQLENLERLSLSSPAMEMEALARDWWRRHREAKGSATAALVADDAAQLHELIAQARQAVIKQQPLPGDRAFYHPQPRGRDGQVAFVFPGAGNHFAGMGRALALRWPHLLRRLDAENAHLAEQFSQSQWWNGDGIAMLDHRALIFGQVWLGTLISDLVSSFGIRPAAVIGYSLGETTALFATRAWTGRDEMLARMNASPLFADDLAGICTAARRAWNLPAEETVDWCTGVIDRPADVVQAALLGRNRVYLLIVNTPRECVIGGNRAAVAALVADLGGAFHPLTGVTTVHCAAARPVEQAYRALHLLETKAPADIRFYSGAWGRAYPVTRESAADAITRQAMEPFDFTRVIQTAYDDGVRLFVEMGPGASCTRMIGHILQGKTHAARSACVAGQDEVATVLRLLAFLIAEGAAVDLTALFEPQVDSVATDAPAAPERCVVVRTGGEPFQVPPPPASPRRRPLAPLSPAPETSADISPPAITVHAPWSNGMQPVLEQMTHTVVAHARAQEAFLRTAQGNVAALGRALAFQMSLIESGGPALLETDASITDTSIVEAETVTDSETLATSTAPLLNRAMCLEFARGSVARVLGPDFAEVDIFPTRVRLPDEPLMLVDRITAIDGTPQSLTKESGANGAAGGGEGGAEGGVEGGGRVVTEHDVLAGAWYLDGGRIPTCIAVEAGQADLFLSGYLGIDSITRGHAVYRLLDAVVTFHGPLPQPGQTIVYDITIEHFFRQGATHLFRFQFDATVDGRPVLTMRQGCAGFFTEDELAAGQGIVQTSIDKQPRPGKRPADWLTLAPMTVESFTDAQIAALREEDGREAADLTACFGELFRGLPVAQPVGLPSGRMTLVHRVLKLDPTGGRYGLGQIIGEADIHPDDWFLACHFVDDRVMPGTLMYECCLHTLRIFLLRMGWVGERGQVVYEPIPGVAGQLKCRGQVTAATQKVQYEVSLKELGYAEDGTPFAMADALMYGDGKPIVQMTNMSLQLTGLARMQIEKLWRRKNETKILESESTPRLPISPPSKIENRKLQISAPPTPLFNTERITAFAIGKPSDAFGEPYKIFDQKRKIARLPGPPYQFLDRITAIEHCQPFQLAAGGRIEAQYDVPPNAWYFQPANPGAVPAQSSVLRAPHAVMPFAVLLEVALQPCGWFAAYLGSALASDIDMSFRNLGGAATQLRPVLPDTGTLTTAIKITNVSHSGGMIIQHFDMAVRCAAGDVYHGTTYFGFFSKQALANQIGIRDAAPYRPGPQESAAAQSFDYPDHPPFANRMMRMVDRIDHFDPAGGPRGLGFIRGTAQVDPAAWFFKAHFFEDPVWPGSLGLESFLQLLQVVAVRRWGGKNPGAARPLGLAAGEKHTWIYRGQILPTDRQVTVQAVVTKIDDSRQRLHADGFLEVDGRIIYQMKDFVVTMLGLA